MGYYLKYRIFMNLTIIQHHNEAVKHTSKISMKDQSFKYAILMYG